MNKTILVDADGVLLNWDEYFMDEMTSRGFTPIQDSDKHYYLEKRFHEAVSKQKEIRELIVHLNESEKLKHLPPFKDCVPYIKKLHNEGYSFVMITSVSEKPITKVYRLQNLNEIFGENIFHADNVICLGVGASKKSTLEQWKNSGLIWVEDKFENAVDGYNLGLKSYLIDAPYNIEYNHKGIIRTPHDNPWAFLYNEIKRHYE